MFLWWMWCTTLNVCTWVTALYSVGEEMLVFLLLSNLNISVVTSWATYWWCMIIFLWLKTRPDTQEKLTTAAPICNTEDSSKEKVIFNNDKTVVKWKTFIFQGAFLFGLVKWYYSVSSLIFSVQSHKSESCIQCCVAMALHFQFHQWGYVFPPVRLFVGWCVCHWVDDHGTWWMVVVWVGEETTTLWCKF